jgi:hypothetical protein
LNDDAVEERSETAEAQVLSVIRELVAKGPDSRLAVRDITSAFLARYGNEYERRITPHWIGSIVRRRLGLRPSKSTGTYLLRPEDVALLPALYLRYGLVSTEHNDPEPTAVEEGETQNAGA